MQKIPIPLLFPIPTDEDDFEDLCVDLLKIYWNRPGLVRYGTRGQRQNGVDILDLGGITPLHAAQCKLREFGKTLSPTTIENEVTDALGFEFSLGKYGILTTAKVTTHAQRKVLEINQRHRELRLFEIELLTWGKLCSLIQTYEEVRKTYFERTVITADSRVGSKSPIISEQLRDASSFSSSLDLTGAIDEARDAINKRDFQAGLLLLNRIRQREGFTNASNYDKFRVSSNLAAAELGLGRPDVAADHFFDAVGFEPSDERAKTNEVFAHILKGDNVTAFSRAQTLRAQYPTSSKLAVYWVISSPPEITLEKIEQELPKDLSSDPDVALALSRKALAEMSIARALGYAEFAARAAPENAQAHLLIARSNMGEIVQSEAGITAPSMQRAEIERRIELELTETMRLATTQRDIPTQVEALVLRADLRLLQKRSEEAEADAYEALRLDPENVQALLALSHLHDTAKRLNESIRLLERAHRKGAHPEATFLYARALLQRGAQGDDKLALSLLTSLDVRRLRPEFRPTLASAVVNTMLRLGDKTGAKEYLGGIAEQVAPAALTALHAHIAIADGNKAEAEALALQAKGYLTERSGADTKEFLARLFMKLEMFAEALPIFEQLFELNIGSFDSGQLLDCAARLHRDDIVLETCAELERRGQDRWEVVSFEVQYLRQYSRDKALARLDKFLRAHPGHKLALLMRSVIGVQSQQPNLVSAKLDDLPTVEELQPEYIETVIHVLRFSAAGNATVDYAYRFLRLHFDDIRAHRALMLSLMPGDPSITIPPTEELVAIGSAVRVDEDLSGAVRWFVLEETDKPDANFEELSATSNLAKELIGKQVGDAVILAKGHTQNRTGIIRQIMPRYVRRFQDVMAEMQVRFGSRSSVEAVHIGSTEEEVAKGLEKVLESVKKRETAVKEMRRIYDELPVSLHLFGDRFGENAYIALAALAQEEGQFVKCALGTQEERRQGVFALQTAAFVVVDLTAVATVRLLGMENLLLESKRFRFQMSEGTFNELQETLLGDLFSGSASGTVQHRAGIVSFTQETAEQKSERRRKDQEFLERLKTAVEIVPAMELSTLDPAKREPLEKMFGQYGAESIVLSSNPDAVLWTDDVVEAELAKNEFGVRRAWTELIAEQNALAGQISDADKERVVASLIGMEFSVTSFDSAAMLRAVEMSAAAPWRTPLRQFVDVFRKPSANLQGLLGIFVDFIVRLYREPQLPQTRCEVLTAFLDAIWGTIPVRVPLLRLRKASAQFFGLNCVGQEQFDECFDQWYAQVSDKILGP